MSEFVQGTSVGISKYNRTMLLIPIKSTWRSTYRVRWKVRFQRYLGKKYILDDDDCIVGTEEMNEWMENNI